uniref:Late embryogenesis abundant protein LEA-2 subgroup domain-containing protein n=1 Tax=Oryza punctata TaxID=4537 RepID=A0A0E0L751_ORYPU
MDDGSKLQPTARFRWLNLARCTVASVVTVLAVVVIARAVVVLLRPEKLRLSVAGGRVSINRMAAMKPLPRVNMSFVLRAFNPSGRASVEYTGLTVTLRAIDGDAASPATAAAIIAQFPFPDVPVAQQMAHEAVARVSLAAAEDVPLRYVKALFDGGSISAAIQVDGFLTTRMEIDGRISRSDGGAATTFYCLPVTVAVGDGDDDESTSSRDTWCLDKSDVPAFVG